MDSSNLASSPGPSVAVMIRRARAHWRIALLVLFAGLLATAQVVRTRKLTYRSETVIYYREGIQSGVIGESGRDPLKQLGPKLKEILLSKTLLEVAIAKSHIDQASVRDRGIDETIVALRKRIDFKARTSDTFAITYDGSSREEAQDVSATLADLLIREMARRREEAASSATAFLTSERARLEEELRASDRAVAKFVGEHPAYAIDPGSRVGVEVRADQKDARAQGNAAPGVGPHSGHLPSSNGAPPAPQAIDPALLDAKKAAQAELAKAQRELDELSQKYTADYPDVQGAMKRRDRAAAALAVAEAAIADATAKAAAAAPAPSDDPYAPPAPIAKAPVPTAASAKARTETPAEKADTEARWQSLLRDNEAARLRVTEVQAKLSKAELQSNAIATGEVGQLEVRDPATMPASPITMPRSLVLLIGLIASALAAIAGAAARGIVLDDRIFDASEIEGLDLVPVLAIVPVGKKSRALSRV